MGALPGGGTALRLMASALEDGTVEQYDRHWRTYCTWCQLSGREPLPSTPRMVAAYIGWLAERGTIAAGSLQPYLSAINSMHEDFGLARPALGHLVKRARGGMARGQALMQTRDERVALPANAAMRVLDDALTRASAQQARLPLLAFVKWLRRRYATVLGYVFFGRQDSCVSLLSCDHGIDDGRGAALIEGGYLWLRLTEKMRRRSAFRRVLRLPLDAPPVRGHASALPRLAALGRIYACARAELVAKAGGGTPPYFFQLPGEPKPITRHMSAWVSESLTELGIVAPPGFVYLGHSLRSGGSSAAEAIGVSRFRGNWVGGWAQGGSTRETRYIDPSVTPSPAAYALFGWLLDGEFRATVGAWVRTESLRVTDDPGEPA